MSNKHDSNHAHPVSLKALFGVWAVLIVLTWATVSVASLNLGSAGIFVAMGIAALKSVFVGLIFMHLLWDKAINSFILVSAMLFVCLFIAFAMLDTKQYHADLIPGYAPTITGGDPLSAAGGAVDGSNLTGIERGKFLYTTTCVTCHGEHAEGKKDLNSPALHQQEKWYLVAQLEKFRSGLRGGDAAIDSTGAQMRPMAVALPDEQALDDVAEYIISLDAPPPAFTVEADAEAGATYFNTICIACHGTDGAGNVTLQSPVIAQQHDWYVVNQLTKFRTDIRGADTKDVTGGQMRGMALAIPSDEMVENLAAHITRLGR